MPLAPLAAILESTTRGVVRLEVASRVGYLRSRGAAPRPMTRATSMWAIRESGGVTFGAPGYAHRIFLIDIIHMVYKTECYRYHLVFLIVNYTTLIHSEAAQDPKHTSGGNKTR